MSFDKLENFQSFFYRRYSRDYRRRRYNERASLHGYLFYLRSFNLQPLSEFAVKQYEFMFEIILELINMIDVTPSS